MNPIGIMQGRLTPPIHGKIQAFPHGQWKKEFKLARNIGFDAMELIFDGPENPLYDLGGAQEVRETADAAGIKLSSVCTDYSMYYPLFGDTRYESLKTLIKVLKNCSAIGMHKFGISFEDNSSIVTQEHRDQAIECMKEIMAVAEDCRMTVTLETSFQLANFKAFIAKIGSPFLKVNFDTGNSCAYGEDSVPAILSFSDLIGGVHIKDRTRIFGKTVPLGTGETDLAGCFKALKKINYRDTILIQAARQEDDLKAAASYLQFVKNHLEDLA